ncbi:MAG: dihydropteroate synthase [candidate division Zixibacteria bacterium]|nr:dihydropteroate synthase [candidate division Zixibacteria bacterium]
MKQATDAITLANGRLLPLSKPLVMGVINITPDSFSDGRQYLNPDTAVEHALRLESEGADMLDLGGESSRPGAEPLSVSEELARVIPVLTKLRSRSTLPISIDTYHAETARVSIENGADIINDITALQGDSRMAEVVKKSKAPLVLMHMQGTPKTMQKSPFYDDVISEIDSFFTERIDFCVSHGIDRSKIILDPGIGFGKRLADNLAILNHLSEFRNHGLPILIGLSRKSFISKIHPTEKAADNRLGGSLAGAIIAVQNGANIIRVHDVRETVQALAFIQALWGDQ